MPDLPANPLWGQFPRIYASYLPSPFACLGDHTTLFPSYFQCIRKAWLTKYFSNPHKNPEADQRPRFTSEEAEVGMNGLTCPQTICYNEAQ